ncbi:MAG: hypothetical protein LKF31_08585 [Muribaculaceae bacterium]|jgi:hypothetical protein|nr:hypothetical protein [Muribaculaceae bacterium]
MKSRNFAELALVLVLGWMILILGSCSKSDDAAKLSENSITMKAGTTHQLKYDGGTNGTWTSGNELIASVSGGLVTAKRVGETLVSVADAKCKVTVEGVYNTYREPCMTWGATMDVVKNFMSGYTLSKSNETSLLYTGKDKEINQVYVFKNSVLSTSGVIVPLAYLDELASFMAERYVYITKTSTLVALKSVDGNTLIAVGAETMNGVDCVLVAYGQNTSSKSSGEQIMEKKMEEMATALGAEKSTKKIDLFK